MVSTGIKHPLEVLEIIEDGFEVSTKITPETSKKELQRIKKDFEKKIERWTLIWNRSIKAHGLEETDKSSEKSKYMLEFQRTRERLCLQLLSSKFYSKYEDELEDITGSKEFFNLLENIIGTVTKADAAKEAHQALRDISRRIDEEESFTRFYARIEKLAKIASDGKTELQNYFIKETFSANLTPELKRYLLDMDKEHECAEDKAAFLDKKLKHKKKASVRAISPTELLLQEQVDALTAQLAEVPETIKAIMANSDSQLQMLRSEIGEIKKITTQQSNNSWKNERKREQKEHLETTAKFTQDRYRNEKGQNRQQEERCKKCGYTNHRTEECRGTSTKRCFVCDSVGHMSFVCPLKQRFSKN